MFNGETEAKKSISMESNESYESKVPGSWHLDKSAEWTAIDKAKITFDVNNDKDDLVSKINALSDKWSTNYNDPLKHVDSIMENYTKQENRDVVTLFLTDGYPNVDTPNQIATYQMLKSKYPYMAINGIQYEMGAQMTQEIIVITIQDGIHHKIKIHMLELV